MRAARWKAPAASCAKPQQLRPLAQLVAPLAAEDASGREGPKRLAVAPSPMTRGQEVVADGASHPPVASGRPSKRARAAAPPRGPVEEARAVEAPRRARRAASPPRTKSRGAASRAVVVARRARRHVDDVAKLGQRVQGRRRRARHHDPPQRRTPPSISASVATSAHAILTIDCWHQRQQPRRGQSASQQRGRSPHAYTSIPAAMTRRRRRATACTRPRPSRSTRTGDGRRRTRASRRQPDLTPEA